ncbi:MAG: thiaminase/transcriptional activator TenA [Desulforhopalus sp.]|jgi:thiaminase/transcriptional activator TenA
MTCTAEPNGPIPLFNQLKARCEKEWEAYCHHEFITGIGDGSLPQECFRHYLMQDYIFLIHFSRAWALAVYKSENLTDMRAAATTLNAHLNFEMDLHVKYCAGWGITEEELEQTVEANANMAYTRYVLERGLAGDILDLNVALAPCVIGYAVICKDLIGYPATKLEGNPYRDWIEMYAGEEYQAIADSAAHHLDILAASRMGVDRIDSLAKTFKQATTLEIGFWEMGLHLL